MLNGAKRTYLSDLKAEDSEESFKDKTLSEHRIPRSTLAVPSSFPETITWKSSRRAKGQTRRCGKQQRGGGACLESIESRFVSFPTRKKESDFSAIRSFCRIHKRRFSSTSAPGFGSVYNNARLLHQRYFSSN